MNEIVKSDEAAEEINLRTKSPARSLQVEKLAIGDAATYNELVRAFKGGLISLNCPMVFAEGFLFKGAEAEVLEQLRKIPLPREGKKGTNQTTLLKMVVLRINRIRKLASRDPTLEELVRLRAKLIAAQKKSKAAGGWGYVGATDLKAIFKSVGLPIEYWGSGPAEEFSQFACRPDVDEDLLRNGYDRWQVEQVHAA